jgi:hypothetical protein
MSVTRALFEGQDWFCQSTAIPMILGSLAKMVLRLADLRIMTDPLSNVRIYSSSMLEL